MMTMKNNANGWVIPAEVGQNLTVRLLSYIYPGSRSDYQKNGLTRGPEFGNFLYFGRSIYSRTSAGYIGTPG